MEPTLSDYSAGSLERVQTSIAHSIVKNVAGGSTKDDLQVWTLLDMYADIDNEKARRADEINRFIAQRG